MTTAPRFFTLEDSAPFDDVLIAAYLAAGRSVDDLAYTEEFERIYKKLQQIGDTRTMAEVFRRLLNLRKAGRLPRLGQ